MKDINVGNLTSGRRGLNPWGALGLYGKHIEREESGPEKVAPTFKGAERGKLPMKNINGPINYL